MQNRLPLLWTSAALVLLVVSACCCCVVEASSNPQLFLTTKVPLPPSYSTPTTGNFCLKLPFFSTTEGQFLGIVNGRLALFASCIEAAFWTFELDAAATVSLPTVNITHTITGFSLLVKDGLNASVLLNDDGSSLPSSSFGWSLQHSGCLFRSTGDTVYYISRRGGGGAPSAGNDNLILQMGSVSDCLSISAIPVEGLALDAITEMMTADDWAASATCLQLPNGAFLQAHHQHSSNGDWIVGMTTTTVVAASCMSSNMNNDTAAAWRLSGSPSSFRLQSLAAKSGDGQFLGSPAGLLDLSLSTSSDSASAKQWKLTNVTITMSNNSTRTASCLELIFEQTTSSSTPAAATRRRFFAASLQSNATRLTWTPEECTPISLFGVALPQPAPPRGDGPRSGRDVCLQSQRTGRFLAYSYARGTGTGARPSCDSAALWDIAPYQDPQSRTNETLLQFRNEETSDGWYRKQLVSVPSQLTVSGSMGYARPGDPNAWPFWAWSSAQNGCLRVGGFHPALFLEEIPNLPPFRYRTTAWPTAYRLTGDPSQCTPFTAAPRPTLPEPNSSKVVCLQWVETTRSDYPSYLGVNLTTRRLQWHPVCDSLSAWRLEPARWGRFFLVHPATNSHLVNLPRPSQLIMRSGERHTLDYHREESNEWSWDIDHRFGCLRSIARSFDFMMTLDLTSASSSSDNVDCPSLSAKDFTQPNITALRFDDEVSTGNEGLTTAEVAILASAVLCLCLVAGGVGAACYFSRRSTTEPAKNDDEELRRERVDDRTHPTIAQEEKNGHRGAGGGEWPFPESPPCHEAEKENRNKNKNTTKINIPAAATVIPTPPSAAPVAAADDDDDGDDIAVLRKAMADLQAKIDKLSKEKEEEARERRKKERWGNNNSVGQDQPIVMGMVVQ